jgi:hypothetical protein
VKITYLELYNEELTDLLTDITNEQPEKIKIYEDKDKVNLSYDRNSLLLSKYQNLDKYNNWCY